MAAKIWVISDTHFQHENIYKFITNDGITKVRPQFKNAAQADKEMVKRWNATVRPEDHVWHLGDIGWGAGLDQIVKALNGHKRLVLGNHDREKARAYTAMGFQKIQGSHYVDGAWLTHIPVHPSGLYGERINLHGHIHENHVMKWRHREEDDDDRIWTSEQDLRYVNVCVEQIDYRPILLDEARKRAKPGR